jgi:hypothetical protein
MKHIRRINLFILVLATIALFAAPTAHAQQQPPYPPPPYPPQPYPPPYPPPPYPPQQYPAPQYHKPHHDTADFALGATRQLTQPITRSGGPSSVGTTDSTGFLASFRAHPMGGAAVELNYQYTQLTEQYRSPVGGGVFVNTSVPVNFHEATGAFLFESHMRGIRPFLSLGGGAIDFIPSGVANAHNQWRGTGLAEFGFDLPAGRHLGIRAQGRSLFYRAPNFNSATLQSRTWVATVEPAISVYGRW